MNTTKIFSSELALLTQVDKLTDEKREELYAEYMYCNPNDYDEVRELYASFGIEYTRLNWHLANENYRRASIKDNPDIAESHLLADAIALAARAHAGQTDKAGAPYIFHPLRVMLGASNINEQIIAVLHDVVEDTNYNFDDLKDLGLSDKQLCALRLLTHDPEVPYGDYIRAIATNPTARKVKLLDLEDNSDLKRLAKIGHDDLQRAQKYRCAAKILTAAAHALKSAP